ncbi:MAG: hypothetical protein ASARMPREDX12_009594 [Alectoria sarmentosa]|nr:MAG: hypothetical protein ASARMPREDX12_009594 [Alectoria sarmentosa]
MRPTPLWRPIRKSQSAWTPPAISTKGLSSTARCNCSCGAPVYLSATGPLHAQHEPKRKSNHKRGRTGHRHEKVETHNQEDPAPDHRTIGTAQSLFTTHASSPGAPFFQPDGTHIFNKLTAFLRAQYPAFGFREVLTPTMYKQSLWEQSGHWANYKDDMFTVTGNLSLKPDTAPVESFDGRMQPKNKASEAAKPEEFGLKPMNCPGHCLLFQSQRRSYRDLPIRYADFSSLHRNEISGALSGLTRVRRFHQDDGHIFCRPSQVKDEISKSLDFVRLIYQTLGFKDYALVLSTRPEKDYIGTLDEWDRAEDQLTEALNASGNLWRTSAGDGAFYGPKIDITVRDSDGKNHQTATIQLDFQLPKRFMLGYEAPAPDLEAKGEPTSDSVSRQKMGTVTPVMIHRAVLGSLERFMALLLEHHRGQLPFWLSPRQVIILTVTDNLPVIQYAENLKKTFSNTAGDDLPKQMHCPTYIVDVDGSGDSISQKIVRAKKKKYNMICVVGERNFAGKKTQEEWPTLDVDVNAQPNQRKTWDAIEKIKPGSQAPVQKDRGVGASYRNMSPGVRLRMDQCKKLIRTLSEEYL